MTSSGTVAETRNTDCTVFGQLIGKTAFTGFGIGRACSAEQAADAGYMIRYFFHKEYLLQFFCLYSIIFPACCKLTIHRMGQPARCIEYIRCKDFAKRV